MSGRDRSTPIREVYRSVVGVTIETSFEVSPDCIVTDPIPAAGALSIETSFAAAFDCTVFASFYRVEEVYTACVDIVTGNLAYLLREELDGYILAENGTRIVI